MRNIGKSMGVNASNFSKMWLGLLTNVGWKVYDFPNLWSSIAVGIREHLTYDMREHISSNIEANLKNGKY